MDASTQRQPDPGSGLHAAMALYLFGLVAHLADHLRRGTDVVSNEVLRAGAISTIVGLVVVAMIVSRHRHAALAATLFGFTLGIGVAAVHLLPRWSSFSDAFPGSAGTGVSALSWAAVLIEIAGGFALGIAGAMALTHAQRRTA